MLTRGIRIISSLPCEFRISTMSSASDGNRAATSASAMRKKSGRDNGAVASAGCRAAGRLWQRPLRSDAGGELAKEEPALERPLVGKGDEVEAIVGSGALERAHVASHQLRELARILENVGGELGSLRSGGAAKQFEQGAIILRLERVLRGLVGIVDDTARRSGAARGRRRPGKTQTRSRPAASRPPAARTDAQRVDMRLNDHCPPARGGRLEAQSRSRKAAIVVRPGLRRPAGACESSIR